MGVLGVGGLFFRARDPDTLANWYRQHLNVGPGCVAPGAGAADDNSWMTTGGPVVFAPFPNDTDYLPVEKAFMLNLRVSDLARLIDQLRNSGIDIVTKDEWNDPSIGHFARLHDPEGNAIELWEPPGS